jgi:hypothetical protein
MNKKQLSKAFAMDVKTLNKVYEKHFDKIGEYEFRRFLPKQIKAWKEILGEFVEEPKEKN